MQLNKCASCGEKLLNFVAAFKREPHFDRSIDRWPSFEHGSSGQNQTIELAQDRRDTITSADEELTSRARWQLFVLT